MTVKEIFNLRKLGYIEEAYEAARERYASLKDEYTSTAMFWAAVDMLKQRVNENRIDEAQKIYMALKRLTSNIHDDTGWAQSALMKCEHWIRHGIDRKHSMEKGPDHLKMGTWGEELAAAYLREKGYAILERDWHSNHKDIDIVAQQNDCIVFVEVKARRNRDFIEPEQAVDYKKQRNLRMAINHYIKLHRIDNPWRFDVITIVNRPGETAPEINHIEDWGLL